MANPVPAASDVSAGIPSCENGRYDTVSGGDSVEDPYPDRT